MDKKRICQLEPRDVFRLFGRDYYVSKIVSDKIRCCYLSTQSRFADYGINCQLKVEYIGKLTPPETIKELTRHEAVYDNTTPYNIANEYR